MVEGARFGAAGACPRMLSGKQHARARHSTLSGKVGWAAWQQVLQVRGWVGRQTQRGVGATNAFGSISTRGVFALACSMPEKDRILIDLFSLTHGRAVRTGVSGYGPSLAQNSESVGRLL